MGKDLPNFVRGVAAAGLPALRAVPAQLAAWQLEPGARIDTTLDSAEALAAELLAKLKYPHHVFDLLPADAQDRAAVAVGVVPQAAWRSPPVPPGTPDFKAPSWEKDVYAVLFAAAPKRGRSAPRAPAAPADAAPGKARPAAAKAWPELRSLAAWRKVEEPAAVTAALAAALGKGWTAAPPAGSRALPRVRSRALGLALVAIPGGTLARGLSTDEQRALARRVQGLGEEAALHVKELARCARPVIEVKVAPFLCAETPLLAAHLAKLDGVGDAANPHGVARCAAEATAALVARAGAGLRLLAEAEWEWVARAGGQHAWLSGDEDPATWTAATLARPLGKLAHPLGVLGLGWGEWVDDGWHPTYKSAPTTSVAWEPRAEPEVVRGGALALWPWQVGGEVVLHHAAARERSTGAHAVRLARDLPARAADR